MLLLLLYFIKQKKIIALKKVLTFYNKWWNLFSCMSERIQLKFIFYFVYIWFPYFHSCIFHTYYKSTEVVIQVLTFFDIFQHFGYLQQTLLQFSGKRFSSFRQNSVWTEDKKCLNHWKRGKPFLVLYFVYIKYWGLRLSLFYKYVFNILFYAHTCTRCVFKILANMK